MNVLLLFTCIFYCSFAQKTSTLSISQFFPIEQIHSNIAFKVSYMGVGEVSGRFSEFSGTLLYDKNDLKKTSVTLNIKTKSIKTENDWRDKDLMSDKWLDAEKFPNIFFQSMSVKETDNGFTVIGDLKIRNITKTVEIKMKKPSEVMVDQRDDLMVVFNGKLIINRHDFEVTGKTWGTIVGDDVEINLNILGKQTRHKNLKNRARNTKNPIGKIYRAIEEKGFDYGMKIFEEEKKGKKVQSFTLNLVAYIYLTGGKPDMAIKLLKYNLKEYPKDANSYDSLAECYATKGEFYKSKEYYQKSLTLNSDNINAIEILRHF